MSQGKATCVNRTGGFLVPLLFTKVAKMPPSLLVGGMASGGLGAASPQYNHSYGNAPQLAGGWFT